MNKHPAQNVKNTPTESHSRVLIIPIAIGLFGSMYIAWGENPGLFFSMAVLLISGIITIFTNYRQGNPITWETGIPAFYLTMFLLLPLIGQLIGRADFNVMQGASKAAIIASGGLVSFKIGSLLYHMVCEKLLPLRRFKKLTTLGPFSVLNMYSAVWLTLCIGAIAQYYSFRFGYFGLNYRDVPEWPLAGIAVTFSALLDIASAVAWVRYFDRDEKHKYRWRLLSLTTTIVLVGFSFGANSKWFLVQPFIIIMLAQYVSRRRINFQWIAITIIIYFFIAYPAITLFRVTYDPEAARITNILKIFNILKSQELWSVYAQNWAALTAGIDRDLLQSFSAIITQTGSDVEYIMGATYKHGFEALVPRFLWTDKPSLNIGNFIGHYYGLLRPEDEITNISPSQMGELYMNFGTLGVFFGMFAWGWFASLIDDRLIREEYSWISVVCILGIIWQESVFSQAVLPFVKTALSAILFFITLKILYCLTSFKTNANSTKNA